MNYKLSFVLFFVVKAFYAQVYDTTNTHTPNNKSVKEVFTNNKPDGTLDTVYTDGKPVVYMWIGGKPLNLSSHPDGSTETYENVDGTGELYVWENGEKKFKRKLSKSEIRKMKKADEKAAREAFKSIDY